jgi:biopolymer transport protein ExbD
MKYQESEAKAAKRKLNLAAPSINVTPLVDVLLVLLIIFFVIQPQKEAKFETQTPREPESEEAKDLTPPADLLMVDVKTGAGLNQMVELNSKPMSLMELGVTLKGLLEQRPSKTVYLKAPRDKQYEDVVHVIDVIKGSGAAPIGLQIDYLS